MASKLYQSFKQIIRDLSKEINLKKYEEEESKLIFQFYEAFYSNSVAPVACLFEIVLLIGSLYLKLDLFSFSPFKHFSLNHSL